MAASSTTFEERILRIQQRAAQGSNHGVVTPGVAEAPEKKPKPRKARTRGRYLISALGGLLVSFLLVGLGTAFLLSDMGAGTFEVLASRLSDGS